MTLCFTSCNMDLAPEDQLSTVTYFTSGTALKSIAIISIA